MENVKTKFLTPLFTVSRTTVLRSFLVCSFSLFACAVNCFAQASSAQTSSINKEPEIKILFLGDSITAGYGVTRGEAYPDLLEAALKRSGKKVQVINGGLSNSISSSAYSRLKFYLKRSKPTHVVIAIGGNDARQGVPVKVIEENLDKAIVVAKEAKVKVILAEMKMFPNLGKDYVKKFTVMYNSLAKKHGILLLPFLLEQVGGRKELNISDGFHPNKKGHEKIVETILPFFLKHL